MKKNSLRDLTRFHGGLFELEILEIFTTDFCEKVLLEIEFLSQVLQSALLDNER